MESLKTLEMLGWNQGKIDEFRHGWNSADSASSHHQLCADYNLDARTPLTYLPRISEARKGRKASKLAKILSPKVYEALCEAIETGEFTTYKALSEQYNVSLKCIVIEFGKCGDVKRRVVAPDCPLCLSKSQYVWAKKMWSAPQGFTAQDIAKKIGVRKETLLKHFGPINDRDRPKGISETKWEELKKKWCDPKGETRQKIAADFGISYGTLNRYLPPCQSGRRKTQLSMRITPEKLEELRKRIESGNFKSFAALAREYNLTENNLRGKFGNCRDWKKRT